MGKFQLAEINVATLVAPEGDPRVQPFFDALERVNMLAEASPGFIWRLKGDEKLGATYSRPTIDHLFLLNMSVWNSVETLRDFVYRSAHKEQLVRRHERFVPSEQTQMALWWLPEGHVPTIEEGIARLWHLDRYGVSPHAFTFRDPFKSPPCEGTGSAI